MIRAKARAIAGGHVWQDKLEYKRPTVFYHGEEVTDVAEAAKIMEIVLNWTVWERWENEED